MATLGRFIKQPNEIIDYDVDFTDWLAGRLETPTGYTVSATAGITVLSSSLTGNVVKVVLSGGAAGERHKITVRLNTLPGGLIKEGEFYVTIKDV